MRRDLRMAAIAGDSASLERLLQEGEPVDGRDRYGQTALMLAARHGHDHLVQLLLGKGADPDVTAKYGLSALMLAVVNGHTSAARLLVDGGANLAIEGSGAPGFAGKTARQLCQARDLDDLAAYIAQRCCIAAASDN